MYVGSNDAPTNHGSTMNHPTPSSLAEALAATRGGQYAYLAGHVSKDGTVANRLFQVGMKYDTLLARAIDSTGSLTGAEIVEIAATTGLSTDLIVEAALAQIESWQKSLQGDRRDSGIVWTDAGVGTAENVPSAIYVRGVAVHTEYVVTVAKKPVNSKPKTIAKKAIRNRCEISRWRTFRLTSGFDYLAAGGRRVTPKTLTASVMGG
jgi:hypothetical protein